MNHIPRSLFELGAEKSRTAVWMVLAVKCKKTAEDENIFVGVLMRTIQNQTFWHAKNVAAWNSVVKGGLTWAARTSPLKTAGSSVSSFFIAKGSSL